MKTTIEISDPVLNDARRLAAREGVTLRALVDRFAPPYRREKARHRFSPAPGELQGQRSPSGPPRRLLGAPARPPPPPPPRLGDPLAVPARVPVHCHPPPHLRSAHASRALDQIDAWLEAPSLVLLTETDSHWPDSVPRWSRPRA